MENEKYCGWANFQTWDVALWIGNDGGLYRLARERQTYPDFIETMRELGEGKPIAYETPDGVAWNDSGLDHDELNGLLRELRGEDTPED